MSSNNADAAVDAVVDNPPPPMETPSETPAQTDAKDSSDAPMLDNLLPPLENPPENPAQTDTKDSSDDPMDDSSSASSTNSSSPPSPPADPINLIAQAVAQKDQGNTHFKSGNLSLASRSYRKGTSLLKDLNHSNAGDDQVKSLLISLQTNLSMVCYKQNKHQQSRDVASKALGVDATSVKALYRRAVAHRKLADYDAARKDLREALRHDAANRDVQRELVSIKKEVEREKARQKMGLAKAFSNKGGSFLYNDKEEEEKRKLRAKQKENEAKKEAIKKRKLEWEDECVQRMSRGEEAITFKDWDKERKKKDDDDKKAAKKIKEDEDRKKAEQRALQKSNRAAETAESSDSDDDDLDMKQFRGYKKTSDGRTTSYFSREQTEEEKRLLGNIAPQRLDAVGTATGEGKGASAWNQAGTWEEKNTSDWCSKSLTSFLQKVSVQIEGLTGLVKDVKDLTGDASVAFVSAKKRYVFDYHASLCYKIIDSEKEVLASGDLNLPDISSTAISDELEVEVMRWTVVPSEEFQELATKCREEIVKQVRSQVLLFVSAFNAEY